MRYIRYILRLIRRYVPHMVGIMLVQIVFSGAIIVIGFSYVASGYVEEQAADLSDIELLGIQSEIVIGQALIGWGIISFMERLIRVPGHVIERRQSLHQLEVMEKTLERTMHIVEQQARVLKHLETIALGRERDLTSRKRPDDRT